MPTFIARRDTVLWGEGFGHSPLSRKSGFGESLFDGGGEDMSFVSSSRLVLLLLFLWISFPSFGLG